MTPVTAIPAYFSAAAPSVPPWLRQPASASVATSLPPIPQAPNPLYFYDVSLKPERLITLNPLQKVKLGFHQTFVELPKSLAKGFWGDSRYRFDDFLRLGQIPYVLGGATLAGIFALGGHKLTIARQLAAIGLYYAGQLAGSLGVNTAVKLYTGIDSDLRYTAADGQIKRVFTDPTFSRYDLLPPEFYVAKAAQLGIPPTVADPEGEVKNTIANMLPKIRLSKALMGNALAAVGAGLIARSDVWLKLSQRTPGLSAPQQLAQWARDVLGILGHQWFAPLSHHPSGLPAGRIIALRSVASVALVGAFGYGAWLLATLKPKKTFQPAHVEYLRNINDLFGPTSQQNQPDYLMRNAAIQAFQSYLMRTREQMTPGLYDGVVLAPMASVTPNVKAKEATP
ncbi:MAG: hypothetical protein QE263_00830 [Vampirovibrionales bacterium]|nr:hypothetical protein [Vampirovibrionales bacterium]